MTVKQKQWQLFFLGFYGETTEDIDGVWGNKSIIGTRNFQNWCGLKKDGDFGPRTEEASKVIIKAIQEVIGANADGLAGRMTMESTRVFQCNNDLPVTGIADSNTRAKIPVLEDDDYASNSESTDHVANKTGTFWDEIEHFTKDEFKCKCGGRYCDGFPNEPDELLVRLSEKTRVHFGEPMIITSGLRDARHNANCGGVYNSRHLLGKAVDFRIRGKHSGQVLAYVSTLPGVRYAYAIDSNHVHMDVD